MIDINVNNIFFKSFSVDPNSGHSIYVFDSTYLPDPEILGNDKQIYDLLIDELMDRLVEKLPSSPYSLVVFSSGFSQMKISWIYGIKMFSKIPKELKFYLQKTYIVHESFFIRTVYQVLCNAMNIKFLTTSKKFSTKTINNSYKDGENTTLQEDSMGNFSMIHVPNLTILSRMIDITRLRISLNVYLHDYSINEYIDVPEEYFERLSTNSKRKYRQLVFDKIFKKLAMYGPEAELIFQRPGTHRRVNIFLDIIERNNYIDLSQWDLYSLASVFLNFLRNKAKPLIPVDLIVLPIQDDIEYTVAIFHKIVEYNGYFELIIAIFPLFLSILNASETTKHTSKTLSRAIAPTLCKEKISINSNDRLLVGTRYIRNLLESFSVIINTYEHNMRTGRSVSQPLPETMPMVYRTSRSPIRVHSHGNTTMPAIPRPRKSHSVKYSSDSTNSNNIDHTKENNFAQNAPELSNKSSIDDFKENISNKDIVDISRKSSIYNSRENISVKEPSALSRRSSISNLKENIAINNPTELSRKSSTSVSKESISLRETPPVSRKNSVNISKENILLRETPNLSKKSSNSNFGESTLIEEASILSRKNSVNNIKDNIDETSILTKKPSISNVRDSNSVRNTPILSRKGSTSNLKENDHIKENSALSRRSSINNLREHSPVRYVSGLSRKSSINNIKENSPVKYIPDLPNNGSNDLGEISPVGHNADLSRRSSIQNLREPSSSKFSTILPMNNISKDEQSATSPLKYNDVTSGSPVKSLKSSGSNDDIDLSSSPSKVNMLVNNFTSLGGDIPFNMKPPGIALQTKKSMPDLKSKTSVPNLRNKASIPNLRTKQSIPNLRSKQSIPNLRSKQSIANISQRIGSNDSIEQRQISTSSASSVIISKIDTNQESSTNSLISTSADSSSSSSIETRSIDETNDTTNESTIQPFENSKSNVENIKSILANSNKSTLDDMVTDSSARPLELNKFQMFDRELKQQKQKKLKELSTKDTLFAKDFSKINTSNRNVSKVSKLAALYEERLQGLEVMNEIMKNNR